MTNDNDNHKKVTVDRETHNTYNVIRMIDEMAMVIINLDKMTEDPIKTIDELYPIATDEEKAEMLEEFHPHEHLDIEDFLKPFSAKILNLAIINKLEFAPELHVIRDYLEARPYKEIREEKARPDSNFI